MDKPLSSETEEQIQLLCNEIASAEGLDAELHEELYTHVEDKMLGYLNGEVALSEADAFVLAREHFGDRMEVREQMAEVHPASVSAMIFRPVLVALILFIVLHIPYYFIFGKIFNIAQKITTGGNVVYSAFLLNLILLFWGYNKILGVWKKRELNNQSCWYHRLSTKQLVGILGVLLLVKNPIRRSMSIVFYKIINLEELIVKNPTSPYGDFYFSQYLHWFISLLAIVLLVGIVWIWFKWLDVSWKPSLKMFKLACAFVVFGLIKGFGSLCYTRVDSADGVMSGSQDLVILSYDNVQVHLNTSFHFVLMLTLLSYAIAAMCACVGYSALGFFRNWNNVNDDTPIIAG